MTEALPKYGDRRKGMQENMGKYLENYSPPMVGTYFTHERLQDPYKVTECLKEKCCGYSREAQLTALCWALASIYQTLHDTVQHPPGEERENKPTGTAIIPTPATGIMATPTPATGAVATQNPKAGAPAEPENQFVPVSVAPVHKKKYTKKISLLRSQ